MNKYNVAVPFTGVMIIELEAENEKSAKDLAIDFGESIEIDVKSPNKEIYVELSQLEFCEQIVKGNVFFGCQNEIDVELIEED